MGFLSTGGWLHPSLIRQCTDFSSGNNTAFYLLRCYELNVKANKGIIEAISAALPNEFLPFAKLIAENIVCECARADSFGGSDQTSFDTIMIGPNAFIPDVVDTGGMIAKMTNKRTKRLLSGVTDTIEAQSINDSIVDLRVVDSPPSSLSNIHHAFTTRLFPCSNGHNDGHKKAFRHKKKGKKKKKKSSSSNVSNATHEPKWGYKPFSGKRINLLKGDRMKTVAENVVQEYYNNIVGIASSFGHSDSTMLDCLAKMKITNFRQFSFVSKRVQEMFALVGENPLSLEDDRRKVGTDFYKNEIATYVQNFHDVVFKGNSIRKRKRQADDEDYEDMDEMQISNYCIGTKLQSGKFTVLPRASALIEMPAKNFFHFDPIHYIEKATSVRRNSLEVVDQVQSKNGYNLYRSHLDIDGTIYESAEQVFLPSSNSKDCVAFAVGSHLIGSETFYESITHSRFALMMVVLKRLNKSFEDLFLPRVDVMMAIPHESFAYDLSLSSQRIKVPICAFLRTVHGIICVDFDQLRYIDQSRSMKIDRGGGSIPVDLHKQIWDPTDKKYVDLGVEKRKYYEMKKERTSKWNEGVVQYLDNAKYIIGNFIPLNAEKIEICGDDFEDNVIPRGFT